MNYCIAKLIMSAEDPAMADAIAAMPEFRLYECEMPADGRPLLNLKYAGNGEISAVNASKPIYEIQANDTCITLCRHADGRFILNVAGDEGIIRMQCSPDHPETFFEGSLHPRLLKFALWMAYGIRALRYGKVLVHSSAVVSGGKAYLFLGESGTGKSTHTRLWVENIDGATLLNDDSPVISLEEDGIRAYGSPWSGKTPCYRTDSYPLVAITRLSQAKCNEISRLGIAAAFGALHPSLPPAFNYDKSLSDLLAKIESDIIANVPICAMSCLPDKEAAMTSYSHLSSR